MAWHSFFTEFKLGDHICSKDLDLDQHGLRPGVPTTAGATGRSPLLRTALRASENPEITALRNKISRLDQAAFYISIIIPFVASLLGIKQFINNNNAQVNIAFGCLSVILVPTAVFVAGIINNEKALATSQLSGITLDSKIDPARVESTLTPSRV